ncbi:MAG: hypothetical protein KJZ73_05150 [Pseudorhodoplanes sp.]|nr:hypothetical protein [Pseudorhodoplanes sp.]
MATIWKALLLRRDEPASQSVSKAAAVSAGICLGFGLLCAAILVATYYLGAAAGMADRYSFQFAFHFIPAAISHITYGHALDFTAYEAVREVFYREFASGRFDAAFQAATALGAHAQDKGLYFIQNDKGGVLYAVLAFRLFGMAPASLYDLFFLVLAISAAIFVGAFARSPARLFLLACLLLAFFVLAVPLQSDVHNVAGFHGQRALSMLGVVPLLHLLCAAGEERLTPASLFAVIAQGVILVFVCFIRSSNVWAFALLALVTAFVVLQIRHDAALRGHARRRRFGAALAPLVVALLCLLALNTYKSAAFNPRYFSDFITDRVAWHNAYLSTSLDERLRDVLSAKQPLAVGDDYVFRSLENFLAARGRKGELDAIVARKNSEVPSVYAVSGYDRLVREMYLTAWTEHPFLMIRHYVYAKPKLMLRELITMTQPAEAASSRNSLGVENPRGYRPLGLYASLTLLAALALLFLSGAAFRAHEVLSVAALALGTQIPWISVYPFFYAVPESFLGLTFAFYAAAGLALAYFCARPSQGAPGGRARS